MAKTAMLKALWTDLNAAKEHVATIQRTNPSGEGQMGGYLAASAKLEATIKKIDTDLRAINAHMKTWDTSKSKNILKQQRLEKDRDAARAAVAFIAKQADDLRAFSNGILKLLSLTPARPATAAPPARPSSLPPRMGR